MLSDLLASDQLFSSAQLPLVVAMAVTVVLLAILIPLLLGWTTKLACRICRGQPIGLGRGVLAMLAAAAATTFVPLGVHSLVPQTSPLAAALAGLATAILALAIVLRQNPLRALLTYLVAGFLQGICWFVLILGLVLIVKLTVPEERLQAFGAQLGEQLQQREDLQQLVERGRQRFANTPQDDAPEAPVDGQLQPRRGPDKPPRPVSRRDPAGVQLNPFVQ